MRNTSYRPGGGYGRGFGRPFRSKPVEVGKEYDVSITETSRRGDGVTRIEGFVIFVPRTKAGQKARIKITQVGERFAQGEVVESEGKKSEE